MNDLFDAPYISLATFRKSGVAVPTPVWAAPVDDTLWVFSAGDAGKVKRLRASSQAQVAECDFKGNLLGPWHDAEAALVDDPAEVGRAHEALRKKYGWQMRLADWGAKLTGRYNKRAYIRIRVSGQSDPA